MHDLELLVLWMVSVSMGMLLTLALAGLAAPPRRQAITQRTHEPRSAYHRVPRQEGVLVPLGTARVIREQAAPMPPQAA